MVPRQQPRQALQDPRSGSAARGVGTRRVPAPTPAPSACPTAAPKFHLPAEGAGTREEAPARTTSSQAVPSRCPPITRRGCPTPRTFPWMLWHRLFCHQTTHRAPASARSPSRPVDSLIQRKHGPLVMAIDTLTALIHHSNECEVTAHRSACGAHLPARRGCENPDPAGTPVLGGGLTWGDSSLRLLLPL